MRPKVVAGAAVGAAFLAILVAAIVPGDLGWPEAGPGGTGLGVALWEARAFEVLLQAVLILGGVVAILLLLEAASRREVRG